MKKNFLLSLIGGAMISSSAFAATIYVGADGKFYDAVSGGNEVSYTTGDSFNFQTGVTSWNITQNISGGGGIYVNTKPSQ